MEFGPLTADDRMTFGGAGPNALISDDSINELILIDETENGDEHKVEVVLTFQDDEPEVYMIVTEDRPSAVLLGKSIGYLLQILCFNPRPILAAMVAEGLPGSQIGV